jgi:DNA-binding LacI/PurR family transcriptional regulator
MTEAASPEVEEESQDLTDLLNVFLQDNSKLTGIFASNDFLALATIRSTRSLKLSVPRDISIVGFDSVYAGSNR